MMSWNKLQLLFIFLLGSISSLCQKQYKINFPVAGNSIDIRIRNNPLQITGYNGTEVIIEADSFPAKPKEANGLDELTYGVKDNTGIGLFIVKDSNLLTIMKATNHYNRLYRIKIPVITNLKIEEDESNGESKTWRIENLSGEIELRADYCNINLDRITGPAVVYTGNGTISASYSSLDPVNPNSLISHHGSVDVTLPSDAKANIKVRTYSSGDFYTDFEITKGTKASDELSKMKRGYIEGTINGGGVSFELVTTSNGNIYLRKGKRNPLH